MLRNLNEEDLPTLFEQQLDPAGNTMAGFTRQNPSDWNAFEAHWRKNLADPTIIAKVILHENRQGEILRSITRKRDRRVYLEAGLK